MTGEAKKAWRYLVKELYDLGLLTIVDRDALAAYCQAQADYIEAREHIKADGKVILSPKGYPIQSPWVPLANKALEQMVKLGAEFGLTPSSRTRLKVEPAKEPMSLAESLFLLVQNGHEHKQKSEEPKS